MNTPLTIIAVPVGGRAVPVATPRGTDGAQEAYTWEHAWSPDSHPPRVPWRGVWKGKIWRDMGGCDEAENKLGFALFRRGLYTPPPHAKRWWDDVAGAVPVGGGEGRASVSVPVGGWRGLRDRSLDRAHEVAARLERERVGRGADAIRNKVELGSLI